MRCEAVAQRLVAMVDDPQFQSATVSSHLSSCLRCQGELARYRRIRRDLQALSKCTLEPPAGLLPDLLDHLGDPTVSERTAAARHGRRVAYVVGLAAGAAGAASAVGAVVLANKGRSRSTLVG